MAAPVGGQLLQGRLPGGGARQLRQVLLDGIGGGHLASLNGIGQQLPVEGRGDRTQRYRGGMVRRFSVRVVTGSRMGDGFLGDHRDMEGGQPLE